jgi:hypothetical protein
MGWPALGDTAATHFLGSLCFLVIALLTAGKLTLRRTLSSLIFFPSPSLPLHGAFIFMAYDYAGSCEIHAKARANILAFHVGDAISILASLCRHIPNPGGCLHSVVNDRRRDFYGRLARRIDPDR